MIMSFSSISCAFSKTFSCPTEISPNFNVLYKQLTLNMLQCLILLSFHFFLSAVQPFGPFGSAGRPVLRGGAHRFGLPLAANSRAIGAVCHAFPPLLWGSACRLRLSAALFRENRLLCFFYFHWLFRAVLLTCFWPFCCRFSGCFQTFFWPSWRRCQLFCFSCPPCFFAVSVPAVRCFRACSFVFAPFEMRVEQPGLGRPYNGGERLQ